MDLDAATAADVAAAARCVHSLTHQIHMKWAEVQKKSLFIA